MYPPLCYYEAMKNETIARILTGLAVLAFGIGALLDAINIIEFWSLAGTWWPLAVILGGVLLFINDFRQYITTLALIAVGTLFQLNNLDIIEVNIWALIWPVVIIAVGIAILTNRVAGKVNSGKKTDTISAILGGSESSNNSKDYKGGKITAVLGGVSLDLRDAEIKKEATIEVFALMGGVELKVPREWRVQSNVFPILGGVEGKALRGNPAEDAPVLIITGTATLGGVEIN